MNLDGKRVYEPKFLMSAIAQTRNPVSLMVVDMSYYSVRLTALALIEIKHLNLQELPAAVELDRLCFGGLWTLEAYRRELESPKQRFTRFVDGRKKEEGRGKKGQGSRKSPPPLSPLSPALIGLGCLWAILEEGHITMLGIRPDYQGQGLGKILLYALLKSAHQRKLEWVTLEVRASNLVAISLYHQFGFREAGRRRGYYQEPEEDALILWRSGVQKPEFEQDLAKWEDLIKPYTFRQVVP